MAMIWVFCIFTTRKLMPKMEDFVDLIFIWPNHLFFSVFYGETMPKKYGIFFTWLIACLLIPLLFPSYIYLSIFLASIAATIIWAFLDTSILSLMYLADRILKI
jgi:hypothetical protein